MSRLERATHISLIIVALVSIGLILEKRFAPGVTPPNTQQMVGRHLSVAGARWDSSSMNVVLYMSTQCRFCSASMPFYRRIAAERDGAKSKTALTVLSLQPAEEMRVLLSRERVPVDGVFIVSSSRGLPVTPMLFIVDSKGIVKRVFQGQLDSSREEEVLKIVKTGIVSKG